MDDKEKKLYIKPDAEIVSFITGDIITLSTYDTDGFLTDGDREDWDEE